MTTYAIVMKLYAGALDKLRAVAQLHKYATARLGIEDLQTKSLGMCKVIRLSEYPRGLRRRSGQQNDVDGRLRRSRDSRALTRYSLRSSCGFSQELREPTTLACFRDQR